MATAVRCGTLGNWTQWVIGTDGGEHISANTDGQLAAMISIKAALGARSADVDGKFVQAIISFQHRILVFPEGTFCLRGRSELFFCG